MPVLQDKIALITGAASGIGLASARRFALEGATVVGIDRDASDGWRSVLDVSSNSRLHRCDVTEGMEQNRVVEETVAEFGRIDILLAAAGIAGGGPINMLDEAGWDKVVAVNLKGTMLSIKAVIDTMMQQRSGSIITVASVEGINGTEGGSAYNASKGGVVLLTKNVAIDYGRMGIRCNTICPGFIDTPLLASVLDPMPEFKADIQKQIKLGRLGRPEEIAAAACFLASDDASYVTGQCMVVDGGYSAGHSHGIVEMMGLT